ncbi:T9SS type A sorting domain-containing protein [Flavobacterium sp.]|uniref:T9SS type A sorting domain-containing protein n=1 Tax=Flavobacterium sp. TaxID=239 RepID=UPI003B99BBFB
MKKALFIFLITLTSYSQSISKQVIGSSGSTSSNSYLKLNYTVGQPVVGLMTAGGSQLGNGYYQAMDLQALSVEDSMLYARLKVYPNPTAQYLSLSHPEMNSFGITIVDLNGKQLYKGVINKEEALDVSNYTKGIYLVTVENAATKKNNTYKIIKK